ncbi:hypothetical protein VH1709_contig00012-0007 [Vibrio harveyi]|uniref:hypothetical protein n=1 Tax=Vibrio harveyi TaxID=669 RepID=UPI000D7884FF|nr:hypothetical protein [Vibrio harveyi]GBK97855.1 hypothetical protein VH1709_contig00012-0007 [Vibrio harveyi]
MTAIPLDTYKAIKRLQNAGMNEKQAEEMVNLFGEMYANEAATNLKADLTEIKTDLSWIKKFMFCVGVAVLIAALKYIFLG